MSKTEAFVERAKTLYGDIYDYSKIEYINSKSKLVVTCLIHGQFDKRADAFIAGKGCPKCVINSKTKTNQEFIKEAKEVHGDTFDYSNTEYINKRTKVTILCKQHGPFEILPHTHTSQKIGCAKCSGCSKKTTEQFIQEAIAIHGDRYDYSKVEYKSAKQNVIIICSIHGEFSQRYSSHITNQSGCPNCCGNVRKTTSQFIEDAQKIHKERYDYSLVDYKNKKTKVTIICKQHGLFNQTPSSHLSGSGCPHCSQNIKISTDDFIKKAMLIHKDKYDYSKVLYDGAHSKIIIICIYHNMEFNQYANDHLKGKGCKKCADDMRRKSHETFLNEANKIHGGKYTYEDTYINRRTKMNIICEKHGFFTKTSYEHISRKAGCPKCAMSGFSKQQIEWLTFLEKYYGINIQHMGNSNKEYCIKNTNWKADGYCEETNTIYEFNGQLFHSDLRVYKRDDIHPFCKCTHGEVYDKTIARENRIRELGYNLIVMWEYDWLRINALIKTLQHAIRSKLNH